VILGAILLLIVAAAFVAAELFVPSHGVLGFFAILCAIGSVIFAYQVTPILGFLFGLAVVILTPLVFYWAIRLYPKTPVGKRVILDAPGSAASEGFTRESESLAQLVGKRGVAMTMLRPAGTIDIGSHRIDAVSESEIIYPNTPVEVIRVVGLKVIVKACSESKL
jgi:membrane-bound ClpP family serine protease